MLSNFHNHHQRSPVHHQTSPKSTFTDTLVKIILILLSSLLLANCILFYKMWWLEAKIGAPLTNLEEVLIATVREHGGTLDRETWLKVLQRQEAAHQLEMQKWHDLLGMAASTLAQVFLTLSSCTVECFTRFCFVVKTSADNVILQIFDIFSHDFSLFSTQLTLFRPKNSNWFEQRLNSCEKMSKICKII